MYADIVIEKTKCSLALLGAQLLLPARAVTGCGGRHSVLLDHGRNATSARANDGWKGAMLLPYANRIANGTYTFNGKRYFLERNEDRTPYGREGLHGYLRLPQPR